MSIGIFIKSLFLNKFIKHTNRNINKSKEVNDRKSSGKLSYLVGRLEH